MINPRDISYIEITPRYRKEWVTYCSFGSNLCDKCLLKFRCFSSREKRIYLNEHEWNSWKSGQGMYLETFIEKI